MFLKCLNCFGVNTDVTKKHFNYLKNDSRSVFAVRCPLVPYYPMHTLYIESQFY